MFESASGLIRISAKGDRVEAGLVSEVGIVRSVQCQALNPIMLRISGDDETQAHPAVHNLVRCALLTEISHGAELKGRLDARSPFKLGGSRMNIPGNTGCTTPPGTRP
jgi:hypothetical protein